MKNIKDKVERVHYTSYCYESIKEKHEHIAEMQKKGYEFLTNFEDEYQAAFRKFLGYKINN